MKNWSSSGNGELQEYRVVYLDAHYEKVRVAGRCFPRSPGSGASSTWPRMLRPMPTIGLKAGR